MKIKKNWIIFTNINTDYQPLQRKKKISVCPSAYRDYWAQHASEFKMKGLKASAIVYILHICTGLSSVQMEALSKTILEFQFGQISAFGKYSNCVKTKQFFCSVVKKHPWRNESVRRRINTTVFTRASLQSENNTARTIYTLNFYTCLINGCNDSGYYIRVRPQRWC